MLVTIFEALAIELGLDVYDRIDSLVLVGDDIELIISETENFSTFDVIKNYFYDGSHLCGTRTFKAQTITEVVTLIFMSTASEDLISAHFRGETELLQITLATAKFEEELMRELEIRWNIK